MSVHEREDMQCVAIDNGKQCPRGFRNIKRMLCNMHNSRWQRHGQLECIRNFASQEDKEEQRARGRRFREAQLKAAWSTLTCLCIHTFDEHKLKGGCTIDGCLCRSFSGVSVEAVKKIKDRMASMGFVDPIRDEAYCLHCREYVQIGRWFDGNVIPRMREHLRSHLAPKWAIALYRATG